MRWYLVLAALLAACSSAPTAAGPPAHDPCGWGSPDPWCACPAGSQREQIGNYSDGAPIFGCVAT